MAKYTRDEVEKILSKGIWTVKFTKTSDATLCTINCTRDFDWLRSKGIADEMNYTDPKGGYCPNPAIKVWCIDKMEEWENGFTDCLMWRSFYPETIESIEYFAPTDDSEIEIEEQD